MKICPRCRLPVRQLGNAYAATDGDLVGVVAICKRCSSAEGWLQTAEKVKRVLPALECALHDPSRYYCALMPDAGAADLAVAFLGHPKMAGRILVALGWMAEDIAP